MGVVKVTPISNGVKIFFSGSKRGGEEHRKNYPYIISCLKKHGEVMTEFMGDSDTEFASKDLSSEDTYIKDIRLLENAEVVFAEVSVPSLGVGYEIAYAERYNKPIICLCNKIAFGGLSSMIEGNKNIKLFIYDKLDEIDDIIKRTVENL